MRILLLCSAFNGLTQRAWLELRARGHQVTVELAVSDAAILSAVRRSDPDLIICPFLRQRVPAEVWTRHRTIIVHPGPKGDRGPSSLDWAIMDDEPIWGVTALQAVEEMDAGPIWATRTFSMDPEPPTKSAVYRGPVADAAIELIGDVVDRAADPTFEPEPLDERNPDVIGRLRPAMRAVDREFSWSESTAAIVRRIRAADGSPGVRTNLCGTPVSVFDAHTGPNLEGEPGTIARRHHHALLVHTGDGSVWIGQVRTADSAVKLPAALALGHRLGPVIDVLQPLDLPSAHVGRHEIGYHCHGDVGVLSFDFYNGAMSTSQCQRLTAAVRHAARQQTKVLVLRGGDVFSNGIHLNVIEAAASPSMEAWRNINAIDDLCREIIGCTSQLVITSMGGSAGAGGVMLALGADRVVARNDVVLNPHYETMGLYGSEYWTYVLPRRIGECDARRLTQQCLPISATEAGLIGLVDDVLEERPADFDRRVLEHATELAERRDYEQLLTAKREARAADELAKPLAAYRAAELAEMSRDLFDDRHGFAAARHAFVTKERPTSTPARLAG